MMQARRAIKLPEAIYDTPKTVLGAIHDISIHSQHNFIITWLPPLLRDARHPVISEADRVTARVHHADLDKAVEVILEHRSHFSKLQLPLEVDYAVHRVIFDNAAERTAVAQTIVKTLVLIGPIAHILEKFAAGIGKIFAAFTDDLLGEAAELTALRGSGFTWKELIKRSRLLIPVLVLATYGAYSVEGLLEHGHLVWGGVVFGFSAVALSLTTAIQSFFLYRRNVLRLIKEGKVAKDVDATRLALHQDFTNPARLGLFAGAACAPFLGILGALLGLMHNGWILAAIGSTESIVAGLTVIFSAHFYEYRFARRLKKLSVKK